MAPKPTYRLASFERPSRDNLRFAGHSTQTDADEADNAYEEKPQYAVSA